MRLFCNDYPALVDDLQRRLIAALHSLRLTSSLCFVASRTGQQQTKRLEHGRHELHLLKPEKEGTFRCCFPQDLVSGGSTKPQKSSLSWWQEVLGLPPMWKVAVRLYLRGLFLEISSIDHQRLNK